SHDKSCCWSYNPTSSKDEVVWAPPGSLATTAGISMLISFRRATEMFQFTHCPPSLPMCSAGGLQTSLWRGCPIRNLRVHRLHAAPPERFAGLRVLHRPSAPRHPPRTLSSLFSSLLHICSWCALAESAPALALHRLLAFPLLLSC